MNDCNDACEWLSKYLFYLSNIMFNKWPVNSLKLAAAMQKVKSQQCNAT